jgi:hypothetical protein
MTNTPRNLIALGAVAALALSGCSSTQPVASSEDLQEFSEAAEQFSSSAEASGVLAMMKLGCTEVPLALRAWEDVSVQIDFEAMERRYSAFESALDYHQGVIAEYDWETFELAGDELREEPLLYLYGINLGVFDGRVEMALDFASRAGFPYSANFLNSEDFTDLEAVCEEVESTEY